MLFLYDLYVFAEHKTLLAATVVLDSDESVFGVCHDGHSLRAGEESVHLV